MHSVMLLIASFGALAGLYVLLDAPFTAVTQIIIYAGAIMVLFLFVVMLLNVAARGRRSAIGVGAARADGHARSASLLSVLARRRGGLGAVADGRRRVRRRSRSTTSISSVARHRRGALHDAMPSRSK